MVGLSAPETDPDQALELVVHHLQLAAMYFEATSEEFQTNRDEIKRLMLAYAVRVTRWVDDGGLGKAEEVIAYDDPPALTAALVWFDHIYAVYEEMKKDD